MASVELLRNGLRSHVAPIGNIDPTQFSAVDITMRWTVRNDGTVPGAVAGHIIVQEKVFTERTIVEMDAINGLRWSRLNLTPDNSSLRTFLNGIAPQLTVQPGGTVDATASVQIGLDLIVGKSDLDIVVQVDRLDTGAMIAQDRNPNIFSVAQPAFVPTVIGQATVSVAGF